MMIKQPATKLLSCVPLLAFVAVPISWAIGYSLAYSLGLIGLFSDGFTFKHWQACLTNSATADSLALSLYAAALSTCLATLASLCVVVLWPNCGRNSLFMFAVYVALGTPVVVIAFMVVQWCGGGGWFARIGWHMNLVDKPNDMLSLAGDRWAIGIIAAQFISSTPLLTLFMSQMWLASKGDRICEVASSLGATRWQVRRSVAAPLLLSRTRSIVVLTFMLNLGSYEIPLLLGRQSPQMLSVLTQRRTGQFDITQRPESFALATIYFVVTASLLGVMLLWRRPHAT